MPGQRRAPAPDVMNWFRGLRPSEKFFISDLIRRFRVAGSERDGFFVEVLTAEAMCNQQSIAYGKVIQVWLQRQPRKQLVKELSMIEVVWETLRDVHGLEMSKPANVPDVGAEGSEGLSLPNLDAQSLALPHAEENLGYPRGFRLPIFETYGGKQQSYPDALIPQGAPKQPGPQQTYAADRSTQQQQSVSHRNCQPDCQRGPRCNIDELLQRRDHKWSGIVEDYDHYRVLVKHYMALNDKKAKPADRDKFPEDRHLQKELVRELFEAILDFSDVIDGKGAAKSKGDGNDDAFANDDNENEEAANVEVEGSNEATLVADDAGSPSTGQPEKEPSLTDTVHTKRIQSLSNLEVELLAWELLFATRRAQSGKLGFAKWNSSWKYEQCENFWERFELVKKVCRRSKSVVHGMMTASFTNRLTAAPWHEIKTKVVNQKLNDKRNKKLRALVKEGVADGKHKATTEDTKKAREDFMLDIKGNLLAQGKISQEGNVTPRLSKRQKHDDEVVESRLDTGARGDRTKRPRANGFATNNSDNSSPVPPVPPSDNSAISLPPTGPAQAGTLAMSRPILQPPENSTEQPLGQNSLDEFEIEWKVFHAVGHFLDREG